MTKIFKSEEGRKKIIAEYKNILAVWPSLNKQYHIPTSFGDTYIIELGQEDRPALILLHGTLSNSFSWYSDITILSEHFRVFAVDLIGEAGLSSESRHAYKSGAYEKWLSEVIYALNIGKCFIAGLSLGGWIALRYAVSHPEKVESLALLCPSGIARERRGVIIKTLIISVFRRKHKLIDVNKILGIQNVDPVQAEGMRRALEFVMLISANEKPRFSSIPVFSDNELKRLTMPLLVVYGENDDLLNAPKSIERINKLLIGAETVLLPGVGHAVVNQGPRIAEFLMR